jgi:predicted amino acid dehydrogenase
MRDAQVKDVIVSMPNLIDVEKCNFSVIEACLQVTLDKGLLLNDDVIVNWIEKEKLESKILKLDSENQEKDSKFAFIIHPLGRKHLFNHPLLKYVKPYSAPMEPFAEEMLSLLPGFFYGKIKGIVSEKNGKEVEGLIYLVPETPKKLLEKNVNTIYKKLVNLCDEAQGHGASIIGLGAYTKIVGDAGVTVEAQSPIPVTTGNSLSACATLWAAKFALEKMRFVEKIDGRYQGRVMIVGATGSIGAVSAKILAQSWKEVVLVAPRAYKILELKEEIQEIDKDVNILISTKPETFIEDCDLIITTTSAQGKKILDIERVKPGAIICDVSRPFDIKEEDALKRPDVMVIASGEVKLPGDVGMKIDIGLEGNIVYACLAETALLAMEGKYESFTLSRKINYEKVLEIDRMAHEHGVRLSCIMGHNGFITDEEFELCREHALTKR